MASFAVLHPFCLPELPGVPAPILDAYINRAWFDFAKNSLCWHEWQEVTLQDGVNTYELSPPGGAAVYTVIDAQQGSNVLVPRGPEQLLTYDAAYASRRGTPNGYSLAQDKSLVLYPTPQADDVSLPVRVHVAYVPTLSALTIPDPFAEQYVDALSSGAKARMMAMAGQPWSNPQMAVVYAAAFEAGVTSAVVERMKGGAQGAITVRSRAFV